MSKKDEDNLRHTLNLHRAMQLDKYRAPPEMDLATAFEASTETSRFGSKVVHAYSASEEPSPMRLLGKVRKGTFYADPTLALIAYRNDLAVRMAERLHAIDERLHDMIAGSGLSGVLVAGADVQTSDTGTTGVVVMKGHISLTAAHLDDTTRAMVIALLEKRGQSENDGVAVSKAIHDVQQADDETKKELDDAWADAAGNDPASRDGAIEAKKKADDEKVETAAKRKPAAKKATSAKPKTSRKKA